MQKELAEDVQLRIADRITRGRRAHVAAAGETDSGENAEQVSTATA
ncbi:hypothetical protein ACIRJM_20680 [Streptomyces sp. NPDC102405]